MPSTAIDTVRAWHAALNEADIERLLSLSTEEVEVRHHDRSDGRRLRILQRTRARPSP